MLDELIAKRVSVPESSSASDGIKALSSVYERECSRELTSNDANTDTRPILENPIEMSARYRNLMGDGGGVQAGVGVLLHDDREGLKPRLREQVGTR